ncbi:plexin-B-like protein 4 [Sarcoptes scabiei]|uniref:Plexin-B-like protein 4 n=2 Tax=Sarcoptes scabiei TaxID=52283 RepID=A0A132AD54_SARSC|nr:plexin-B-like protein 4 [Sarcoptes scabiei]
MALIQSSASTAQSRIAAASALSASQMNLNPTSEIIGDGGLDLYSISVHNSIGRNHTENFGLNQPRRSSSSISFSLWKDSASNLLSAVWNPSQRNDETNDIVGDSYSLQQSIPEIYLTRLLTTKGTIQQYVDDFFATIFTVNDRLPLAIKWLFDFFDRKASKSSIQDLNVVSQWKSNSLVQRFWVQILRHREILFDISARKSIDVCFDVLAQNLLDACSLISSNDTSTMSATATTNTSLTTNDYTSSLKLNKDSPATKLLCARDVIGLQQLIHQYYRDIQSLPSINEADIIAYMKDLSKMFDGKLNKERSLEQLIYYCLQCSDSIMNRLRIETQTKQENLAIKFESFLHLFQASGGGDPINGILPTSNLKNRHQQKQQQHSNDYEYQSLHQQPLVPPPLMQSIHHHSQLKNSSTLKGITEV